MLAHRWRSFAAKFSIKLAASPRHTGADSYEIRSNPGMRKEESPDAPSTPLARTAPTGIALFGTAIGHCALAWGPAGLRAVLLPQEDGAEASLRARMQRRFPDLPEPAAEERPPAVAAAIQGMCALLAGEPRDLLEVQLDESLTPAFQRRVYAIARRISPGQTRTYGDIAEELGDKTLARAVGQALGANPFAPVVPCHRVLGAKGWQGGFSAPGGVMLKRRMLDIEGAQPGGQGRLF
jgi:methylated-DNA-[protein]-cysteine S-methyltransferase